MKKPLVLLYAVICLGIIPHTHIYGQTLSGAELYQRGLELEKDLEVREAFTFFEEAAKQGYPEAMAKVGSYYIYGAGTSSYRVHFGPDDPKASSKLARYWFKKAAKTNNAEAMYYAADYFINYRYRNDKQIQKYYDMIKRSAELGFPKAQFDLGGWYLNGYSWVGEKNIEEAIRWYSKAVENGSTKAGLKLFEMYSKGEGVEKDESKSLSWLDKLANDYNNPEAQYQLGVIYEEGRGVNVNTREAFGLYQKAAGQGHAEADKRLSRLKKDIAKIASDDYWTGYKYKSGIYSDKGDAEELALKYFRNSAELGNLDAMVELGQCYQYGLGTPIDPGQAITWYQNAAEQGSVTAQYRLGQCYDEGFGVAKDQSKAVNSYIKAASKGHVLAQRALAKYYLELVGDSRQALFWARKAWDQGDAESAYILGMMYDMGFGVQEDDDAALAFYRQAAEKGFEEARERVKKLEKRAANEKLLKEGIEYFNKKDYKMAVSRFKSAADNNGEAHYWLGYCYENGFGVEKSITEASWHYMYATTTATDAGIKKAGERIIAIGQNALRKTHELFNSYIDKEGFLYNKVKEDFCLAVAADNLVHRDQITDITSMVIYKEQGSETDIKSFHNKLRQIEWPLIHQIEDPSTKFAEYTYRVLGSSAMLVHLVKKEADILLLYDIVPDSY